MVRLHVAGATDIGDKLGRWSRMLIVPLGKSRLQFTNRRPYAECERKFTMAWAFKIPSEKQMPRVLIVAVGHDECDVDLLLIQRRSGGLFRLFQLVEPHPAHHARVQHVVRADQTLAISARQRDARRFSNPHAFASCGEAEHGNVDGHLGENFCDLSFFSATIRSDIALVLLSANPHHRSLPLIRIREVSIFEAAWVHVIAYVMIESVLVCRPQPIQSICVSLKAPAQIHPDRQAKRLRKLRGSHNPVFARSHVHRQKVAPVEALVRDDRSFNHTPVFFKQSRPVRLVPKPVDVALLLMPFQPEPVGFCVDEPNLRLCSAGQSLEAS